MSNFDRAMKFVFDREGGYTNTIDEETNLGVRRSIWEAYKGRRVTNKEFKSLTKEDVIPLYKERYWLAAGCDKYSDNLATCVFDFAVNSGVVRAIKCLQGTLGNVKVDGVPGPATIASANAKDQKMLVGDYLIEREEFLKSIKTFRIYGKGWLNRVNLLRKFVA